MPSSSFMNAKRFGATLMCVGTYMCDVACLVRDTCVCAYVHV